VYPSHQGTIDTLLPLAHQVSNPSCVFSASNHDPRKETSDETPKLTIELAKNKSMQQNQAKQMRKCAKTTQGNAIA